MNWSQLVGDGIENPMNARAILDAADMFNVPCFFRDTRGLADRWREDLASASLPLVDTDTLLEAMRPIVAVENAPGSRPVYGATRPSGTPSVVVGNERRGVGRDVLSSAEKIVHIPMGGRGPNTLNVAAAAAVALYYLANRRGGSVQSSRPEHRRPALLLAGPCDHVEAGSTLRSAAAFGWRSVCLDDRRGAWFDTPRPIRAEGRAAARSHRGGIRVVRIAPTDRLAYEEITIIGIRLDAPLIHRARLATGSRSALILPDESAIDISSEDWARMGRSVRFARIDLPTKKFPYRYRLVASIALAEASRQIGARARKLPSRPPTQRLAYESTLAAGVLEAAEFVTHEELRDY